MNNKRSYVLYMSILATLLATIFGASWIYTYNFRLAFLEESFAQWTAKKQFIQKCDLGSTAIFGDSRASVAYIPSTLKIDGKNLSVPGSTPIETYFEIQKVLRCPKPPTVFIIGFTPRQFSNMSFFWDNARFGEVTFDDMQDIYQSSALLHNKDLFDDAFGAEPPPAMKNWLYANHFPPYDFGSLIAANGGDRLKANEITIKETLEQSGEHRVGTPEKCANGLVWEAKQTYFKSNALTVFYFNRILSILDKPNIKVVIVSPPYSEMSFDKFDQNFEYQYTTFIKKSIQKHRNATISGSLFRKFPNCSFGDYGHLNDQGAVQFSSLAGKELSLTLAN